MEFSKLILSFFKKIGKKSQFIYFFLLNFKYLFKKCSEVLRSLAIMGRDNALVAGKRNRIYHYDNKTKISNNYVHI